MKPKKKRAKKPRAARISVSLTADEVMDLDVWAEGRELKRSEAVKILVTRGCRPGRV